MRSTLVFACDLSDENRAAFARAIRLAVDTGALLDVLHVLDPHLPRHALHDLQQAVVEDMQQRMTDIREAYALSEPECLIQTMAGAPYAEIIREAHERQADMIVLGAHRKRGQPALVAGTTLARVLRGAPCPVLSVSHLATQDWEEILVPVNFSVSCRQAVREALCRFPEARITLLHAWELPGEQELGSINDYAHWRDKQVSRLRQRLDEEIAPLLNEFDGVPELELVLEQGDPLEVLMTRLRSQPPDLLVLGSRGALGRHGTLTERLLSETHCDLMVCRAW